MEPVVFACDSFLPLPLAVEVASVFHLANTKARVRYAYEKFLRDVVESEFSVSFPIFELAFPSVVVDVSEYTSAAEFVSEKSAFVNTLFAVFF